jgi:hypothetical protein
MTIYLYKKTHNKTGFKYLGKTIQDPYKYMGSGTDWVPHIKEHGCDVTTEILKECQSNEELNYWGRYYSKLWSVADSTEWANKIPETGGGVGGKVGVPRSAKTKEKLRIAQAGRKHTEEHKRKAALPKIGRKRPEHSKKLTGRKRPDQSARMKTCQLGPDNHMFGKTQTPESNEKRRNSQLGEKSVRYGKKDPVFECPHCHKKVAGMGNFNRWHNSNCRLA